VPCSVHSIHVKIAINCGQIGPEKYIVKQCWLLLGAAHGRDLLFIEIATKRCKIMRKSQQPDIFMFSFSKVVWLFRSAA